MYQEYLLKYRADVPLPNKTDLITDTMWKLLARLYSHLSLVLGDLRDQRQHPSGRRHRTCEDNMEEGRCDCQMYHNEACILGCIRDFYCKLLVSRDHLRIDGATDAMAQHTLLASNYGCVDARDTIYGLRGLMKLPKDGHMLDPDYSKSRLELYRDSVEAALMNFEKADVLLYITRQEEPSWIPRWNIPMLFFNRFRFGKPMPWKPTGDTKSTWSISTDTNVLSLSGFSLDVITHAESYDQLNFAISIIDSVEGKTRLKDLWTRNLHTFAATLDGTLPLTRSFLTAAAVSLSFGMSHKINAFEQFELLYNFVGYLDIVLAGDRAILTTPKPGDLLEESNSATGVLPVSQYGTFSTITKGRLVGCAVEITQPGEKVFVTWGSTYPIILRPSETGGKAQHVIRGFAYVDCVMDGELANTESMKLCMA